MVCGLTFYAHACMHAQFWAMGYSIRSKDWRYTRWIRWDAVHLRGLWELNDFAQELYSHVGDTGTDMDAWENENLVEQQPKVVAELYTELRKFFDKPPAATAPWHHDASDVGMVE